MILEEKTHPSSEGEELKPSEVLKGFLNKYQSHSTRDLPVRTNMRPEMKTDAQHYTLATPPVTPTRPNPNAELHRPPPGLVNKEYPDLGSAVPSRHEKKTIAQRNLAIARKI